jgi:ketosteroid isomerase-like protein
VSAVLGAYYAALKAGDVAALRDVVAEDVVVTYHGRPGLLPWTGVWRGFDAYSDFLGRVGAARVVNIFTLRDGRVAGYEVFHDTAALWEALRDQVLDPAGG